MATPQPGIFAQGTRSHRHLEFELLPDVTTEATLAALRGLRQPSATAGDANIVIGFSPALWRRIAPGVAPAALTEFPDLDGVPSTEHDIWVWIHGTGLRQLSFDAQVKALGQKEDAIAGAAGFYTEFTGWNGDSIDYSLTFAVQKGDDYIDHAATLRWNPTTGQVSVISDKQVQ